MKIGDLVTFNSKVFCPPWTPYYDAYKGHTFEIVSFHPGHHVELKCVSDPTIIVQGHVHDDEIQLLRKE